ncbi:hypothetical protein XM38_007040 [Halomicronema hongdechloris C2206]|uniref:CRISPR type III-B/RAMP module-associated protein Cmr5 n=1 Tax=Halomicronema hongdechloris C2206 TaxID=1641165 RepID=A0A1Z3HHL4_9CYAN|nr:hypothetical protein [Halomicronema hongdechloris]ASC69775.1 hypothetical protein XM38_007040 [Halomicronema hongdechloris C2206]
MNIDSREFSQQAYKALHDLRGHLHDLAAEVIKKEKEERRLPNARPSEKEVNERTKSYCEKSSSLVQGLSTYIAAWGLHRLTGDAKKFSIGMASDTKYKGKVYGLFLERLKYLSKEEFVIWSHGYDASDEKTLVNMELRKYTALNRLAMQLAKEWGFWATAILGEAKE